MLGQQYAACVLQLAQRAVETQYEKIVEAARTVFPSIRDGGLLHVFGCGHSHIFSEECFYRAGGLVPVNPIFETSTMLHDGAVKSSRIERMSGYAPLILDNYDVKKGETLVIFSTSGINALPVEMAAAAQEKGMHVVAVTSTQYRGVPSRCTNGQHLCDVADIVIDTNVPRGDALISLPHSGVRAVPASTVVGCTVLNVLIAEILECYDAAQCVPPVFTSGNTEGGYEKNLEYISAYRHRVRSL